jgi:hypothetical protein
MAVNVKEHWSAGVPPASWVFLRAGRPRSILKKGLPSSGVATTLTVDRPPRVLSRIMNGFLNAKIARFYHPSHNPPGFSQGLLNDAETFG